MLWYCESNTPLHLKERRENGERGAETREKVCTWDGVFDSHAIVGYLEYIGTRNRSGRRKHLMPPHLWRTQLHTEGHHNRNTVLPMAPKGSPSRYFYLRINLDSGSFSAMTTRYQYDNDIWTDRMIPGVQDDDDVIDSYLAYIVRSWYTNDFLVPISYWRNEVWFLRSLNAPPRNRHFRMDYTMPDNDSHETMEELD